MHVLVDTGVLLRLFDQSDAMHQAIRSMLQLLRNEGHTLSTTSQNIAEFWNVSTRPASARGGYGQSVELTERRVQFIERVGTILADQPGAYQEWRRLVTQHKIQGVSVHDARLVATMRVNSVTTIITLNARDFSRYLDITALSPEEACTSLKLQKND